MVLRVTKSWTWLKWLSTHGKNKRKLRKQATAVEIRSLSLILPERGTVVLSDSRFSPFPLNSFIPLKHYSGLFYFLDNSVRGNTNWNRTHWTGKTVATCTNCQEILVRNMELTSYHQLEEFRKGTYVLPTSQNPSHWNPSWLSDTPLGRTLSQNDWPETIQKLTPLLQTEDCEPRGREVLLCSLTLLLSTQAPLSNSLLLCQHVCLFR